MSELVIIAGDLLDCDAQYVAHQCNCVTTRGKGLSDALFRRFPWADTYTSRKTPSQPGRIEVFGDGIRKRFVINMYSQYGPGKPRTPDDTASIRQQWFADCLDQIGTLPGLRAVAFPHLIGCGLAGGDWTEYHRMLSDWANQGKCERVILVKKD